MWREMPNEGIHLAGKMGVFRSSDDRHKDSPIVKV
jgi:hypothetical protein